MSAFGGNYSLIAGENTVGAFKSEKEIQYHLVNLSLGELCPVTVIYPDYSHNGDYKRVDTLRAHDFYVCDYQEKQQDHTADCDELCISITNCLERISHGEDRNCLSMYVNGGFKFLSAQNSIEYLQFICPISNLIKYAFPIVIKGQLICAIFVGQYSIVNQAKLRSPFTKAKNPNCTRVNLASKQFESADLLIKYISEVVVPEIANIIQVIDENIQKDIRHRIQHLLQEAEQKLSHAMVNVLSYDCASDMEDYGTKVINLFWEAVRTSYFDFFTRISFRNVILFINDDFSNHDVLKRHFYSTTLFCSVSNDESVQFEKLVLDRVNANQLCTEKRSKTLTSLSLSNSEIKKCFLNANDLILHDCNFVYSDKEIYSPYAILIKINTAKISQDVLISSALKIAANINYEMSSVLTKLSEYATKSILRIYRHEIVHQILALRTSLSALNPADDVFIPREKLANIYRDCSDCLYELSFMTENIKLFTGWSGTTAFGLGETQAFKEIDVFKDVINKHIVMHREARKNKSLWFEVLGKTENTHKIICQPLLLDLLLFNIISNAVKYSHAGTNIWFKYSAHEDTRTARKLVICDYGPSIALDDSVYRLYYRGPDLANVETGSGIGLYLSKRLATIMGVNLFHECRKISNYNVALMEEYISCVDDESDIPSKGSPQKEDIIDEMLRLKEERMYAQIVNTNQSEWRKNLTTAQITADISLPTYEVSFILEL